MKRAVDTYLSDALLMSCMSFMLFVFACMWVAPEHIVGMEENNLAILTSETLICIFAVIWSARRVVHNIRKERNEV